MISVAPRLCIVELKWILKDRDDLNLEYLERARSWLKEKLIFLLQLFRERINLKIMNGHHRGSRHSRKIGNNYLLELTIITLRGVINANNSLYKTCLYINQKIFDSFSNFESFVRLICISKLFLTIKKDFPMIRYTKILRFNFMSGNFSVAKQGLIFLLKIGEK